MDWHIRGNYPSDLNYIRSVYISVLEPLRFTLFKRAGWLAETKLNLAQMEKMPILVACSESDKTLIFGFLIYEPSIVHFLYTKNTFRGFGVGLSLWEKAYHEQQPTESGTFIANHPFLKKRAPTIRFNPYWRAEREHKAIASQGLPIDPVEGH